MLLSYIRFDHLNNALQVVSFVCIVIKVVSWCSAIHKNDIHIFQSQRGSPSSFGVALYIQVYIYIYIYIYIYMIDFTGLTR